jgi:sialic acid synthase SpsE
MPDVFVVAEIGKNFIQTPADESVAEYLAKAKALVDAAVAAGVDAVKFQTHEVEDEQLPLSGIISPHFKDADRYAWVKRNTLATPLDDFWRPLKDYCESRGVIFFSTPMSRLAAEKLERLGVSRWKVGSGDALDFVLLDYLAGTGKPIIISTGMVSWVELDRVINYLRSKKVPLTILYCVSEYPCPLEKFNLATIEDLQAKYPEVSVGFSDHSLDNQTSLAAVKLGATMIEKHFSLSRDFWGSDHRASILSQEMKSLVETIRSRKYEKIDHRPFYGARGKELAGATNKFRPFFHRSLVAGADLPVGAILTRKLIYSLRPQAHLAGLASDKFEQILGRRLKRSLKKYEPIKEEDLA